MSFFLLRRNSTETEKQLLVHQVGLVEGKVQGQERINLEGQAVMTEREQSNILVKGKYLLIYFR